MRLPARLITRDGQWPVILIDLSCHGARIQNPAVNGQRGDAVLQWCGREAFAAIAWNRTDLSGLHFHEPIPHEWLLATRSVDDAEHLPANDELVRRHARAWAAGLTRI